MKHFGLEGNDFIYGPSAEKRDLLTDANSEEPNKPAHSRSLVRIFAVRLHNTGALLKI